MNGAQFQTIAERVFSLGLVGAIAAAQALIVAIVLSGNWREIHASPAIKRGISRSVLGIFVLIALAAVGGEGLAEKPVLLAIFFAIVFVIFLQLPVLFGLALHRDRKLTWPVSLAVFAWTFVVCVYWNDTVY